MVLMALKRDHSCWFKDAADSFHLYSMEWTNQKITFAIDDNHYFTYSETGAAGSWPYFNNFFMILNVAVEGNWGGQKGIDDNAFPQQMVVDYVRVYQLK